ncbi:tyrosine-type recombinase/integrase [Mannheimia sp. AT1]|uniref:Tyrosine-type recombinase/integrase n=1 Tax=Mannheimia cairinae TaxID=3025936 RepID=A0ABT5MNY5_9PAST|nr:integrase arm-type DNA-binding domain-containing protein [Mannheimia cairinae]MDD0823891.1 tyrosine-type recombinase/integrase [Mannheimia cairinae]MDD0825207.1 tyrosine-type recombinase/integrase [Mannheimia cairinae]
MARLTTPLTNTQLDKASPKEKEYTLSDGKGLYLLIKPNGSKLWRFNYYKPYTTPKKRALISIGSYPDISLQQARQTRDVFNVLLAQNIDPQIHRQEQAQARANELNTTYENVAWAWLEHRKTKKNFSDNYQKDVIALIKNNLLPHFGKMPITHITAPMAIKAFKRYQDEGKLEKLKRTIQKHNEIMTFALHREMIPANPTANIAKEFDSPTVEHFKTIKPEDLGEFLYTLQNAQIHLQTRYLILWQLLTMTRPNEAAKAKWADIDERAKLWTIPAENMKRGIEHKITLSRQAVALLREIKKLSGGKEYLFPSVKNPQTHVNPQTANGAIKRMGYKGKLVAHGLRSIASTYLNEKGYNSDLIEVALSHMNSDRIKAAYDRGERLEQRFKLLQVWADFVEECSQGSLPQYHLKVA